MNIPFAFLILLITIVSCSTPNKDKNDSGKNNLPDAATDNLTEIYWKLTELNGKAVSQYPAQNKEPYIQLKEDGTVAGTGGCNGMGGKFALDSDFKITFSQMMATEMACPGMELEADFHIALEKIKRYNSNGNILTLFGESNTPIAKFEASERM